MAPRHFTNPAPRTESARQAVRSFYCELCDKGYARMNEFEAHEGSYDHQHKKRLKEMKQMQRDPNASDKARRAERRADEKSGLISIKPVKLDMGSKPAGGGFKKGGFKSAFGAAEVKREEDVQGEEQVVVAAVPGFKKVAETRREVGVRAEGAGSETEEDELDYYDPRRPTDCWGGCQGLDQLHT